jgi:hypothetical protein
VTDAPNVELQNQVQLDSLLSGVLISRIASESLAFVHQEGWRTVAPEPDFGKPVMQSSREHGATSLYEIDGALVLLGFQTGHVYVVAAAAEPDPVRAVFRRLHELLPPPDPSSKHEVPVTFWTYGQHGPQQSWRSISVPGWDEIEENYRSKTRTTLAEIMRGFRPAAGGQLILWHGPAGTGKTFALRALAWEWREWCQINYIVDPDAFFGQHADYLMSVLLEEPEAGSFRSMHMSAGWTSYVALGSSAMHVIDSDLQAMPDEDEETPWRLLILEDAGELIQADARAATGQGLSRFLNVVDGLIGQGLRVLVLVTTNEEVRRLHPAVARPGRCAAQIEFGPLTADEAAAWCETHGLDDHPTGAASLASLFARLEGRSPDDTVLIGFADQ